MLGSSPHDPAAHVDVVLAKICSCAGCRRRPELDQPVSYCFSFKDSFAPAKQEWVFFIPHPLTMAGDYTVGQLAEIERMLAAVGVDLMPLDPALVRH